MSTNLQIQSGDNQTQNGGVVWNRLHSEREEICEALLGRAPAIDQTRPVFPGRDLAKAFAGANESAPDQLLEQRLRLIDDALDRLMAGSYGDCSICGRWIDDTKLEADPALPFCFACQRRSEGEHRSENSFAQATARSAEAG